MDSSVNKRDRHLQTETFTSSQSCIDVGAKTERTEASQNFPSECEETLFFLSFDVSGWFRAYILLHSPWSVAFKQKDSPLKEIEM